MKEIAPAVKTETVKVAVSTIVMTVLMWIVFGVFHVLPGQDVPFDYRVILGGIGDCAVAVLNFFLMGLTVQDIVNTKDEDTAKLKMRSSQSRRLLMQILWVIASIVLPFINLAAGILPLFFPSIGIKLRAFLPQKKS